MLLTLILIVMATLLTPCWFYYNLTSLLSFLQMHQAHFCLRVFSFPLSGKADPYVFTQLTVFLHLGLSFHSNSSERSSLDTLNKQDYLLPYHCPCAVASIQ